MSFLRIRYKYIFVYSFKIKRMKKLFFILTIAIMFLTAFAASTYAQDPDVPQTVNAIDLSTFAGIVAAISLVVTQIAKISPVISEKTVYKILISVGTGILLSFFAWWINIAPFLTDMLWWQVLIQGVLSGGSACGVYDFIKSLFSKQV